MLRKMEAMHQEYYDIDLAHRCHNCPNYHVHDYHGRTFRKCAAYGVSQGSAADWSGRYIACGLYGRDFGQIKNRPFIDLLKRSQKVIVDPVMEG